MICYKDRTWCDFKDCRYSDNCSRILSEYDLQRIENENWLVCKFVEKSKCYKKSC